MPLAASCPVRKEWDRWLNERYNKKAPVDRLSRRVGLPPDDWPESWSLALSNLDNSVRPYGQRLRKLAPKTQATVISTVGLLARSRTWAAERGVTLPTEPSGALFEGFLHYLAEERGVSYRSARDYLENLRMFFLRGGLFDEEGYAALGELICALSQETADLDPGKWSRLRKFRKSFTLADLLNLAQVASEQAWALPGNSAKAFGLRQKGVIYALLVNTGDRQGDIRNYEIGVDIVRDAHSGWHHHIRQAKTGNIKDIGLLWSGTSALIDRHVLGDRPAWQIGSRVAELEGKNLLTLSDRVVNEGYINRRLSADFGIHAHLVRTLIADLLRRTRPDALWALQKMLGHEDRTMEKVYRSEFDDSRAIHSIDALYTRLSG
ncbi:hypothetical protein KUV28_21120 [Ferrimonas balearica]|nr:hypothetical protein [Ferrimonas balearica]